jgi:hypothetical protein
VTASYRAWVLPTDSPDQPICSAKGCRALATTDLTWRNPRIHQEPGRVKHWLACDEHAEFLADFLARRSFLLERSPLTP